MNINKKIEIILNNIKNNHYTSFEFKNNKKRKFIDIDNILENDIDNNDNNDNNLEINYQNNKFYIIDKKILKNIICDDCPICYEKIKIINKITLQCKHILCCFCYYNWEKTCFLTKKDLSCPLCRKVNNTTNNHKNNEENYNSNDFNTDLQIR